MSFVRTLAVAVETVSRAGCVFSVKARSSTEPVKHNFLISKFIASEASSKVCFEVSKLS
jgi:hypothetical protein